ncbi:hypothetical protein ACWDNI_16100 [Nocardia niigatensis]
MSTVQQLRNRRAAACRMVGGDPWPRQYESDAEPTAAQLSAWADAANHVAADGLCPVVPREILRLLWKRGGSDRQLAEQIATNGGAA